MPELCKNFVAQPQSELLLMAVACLDISFQHATSFHHVSAGWGGVLRSLCWIRPWTQAERSSEPSLPTTLLEVLTTASVPLCDIRFQIRQGSGIGKASALTLKMLLI